MVYHGPMQQTYKDLQNSTHTGGRVYDLQTNEEEDDYSRLVELITLLNHDPDSTFEASIGKLLDTGVFLRALALDVATGNWDNYSYNRNNFFMYDDPVSKQFRFISYDTDNTFGVDWLGVDWGERDCKNWVNPALDLPMAQKLLSVPSFYKQYLGYLDTIARTVICPDSLYPRIDFLRALITGPAEADSFRTLDYGYSIGDFHSSYDAPIDSHTPYGLKPFIAIRSERILAQLPHASISQGPEADLIIRQGPVPAGDHITFRFREPVTGRTRPVISDMLGNEIGYRSDWTDGATSWTVETTTFPPGMYLVRFFTCQGRATTRFLKQ
jgi:hypothetical protein